MDGGRNTIYCDHPVRGHNGSLGPYKCRKPGKGVLGQRLKAERIRRGLTLMQLADRVGIAVSQITAAENRGVYPRLVNIMAIAVALECSIDWLVGLED